ncbi:MAG: diphthine synthase [Desulfurococcus sp.]|nr:diphthine synthase [Desulfurococcus sp.]
MLAFVGLGYSRRHLTQEALELLGMADKIYVDTYTSIYEDGYEWIKRVNPSAEVVYARRADLEGEGISRVVSEAERMNVAVACPGDPFVATTHDAIRVEALRRGVEVRIASGVSIVSLIYSRLGLQSYRFGKMVTLVYPRDFKPYSVVETIYSNLERNLHTLILLDLRVEEGLAMTIPEAITILGELDEKGMLMDQIGVAIARLGWSTELVRAGRLRYLREQSYPPPPHSLVITAKLHPVEAENLLYTAGLKL